MKKPILLFALLTSIFVRAQDSAPPKGARHFEGTVKQIIPGGALVEYVTFYDFAPDEVISQADPAGDAKARQKGGIYVEPIRQKTGAIGLIFVRSLGKGMVDGAEWEGMLESSGTKTYDTASGPHTIYAFKITAYADPVAAYRATLKKK